MKIGYARISTGRQNPDSQRDALEEAGCERIYMDVVSGAAEELPRREEALDYLREGDTLVVRRLPRLGRNLKDLLDVIDRVDEKDADFRSLVDGFDTSTAHGRLVFQIFGAVAEFERELIRERTMAGLEAARERGRTGGRPPKLTDSDKERIEELMQSSEAVTVKDICRMYGISDSTYYRHFTPAGKQRKEQQGA